MDKKKIFKKIETGYFSLQDADQKLKADKEIVLAAVNIKVMLLQKQIRLYKAIGKLFLQQ